MKVQKYISITFIKFFFFKKKYKKYNNNNNNDTDNKEIKRIGKVVCIFPIFFFFRIAGNLSYPSLQHP